MYKDMDEQRDRIQKLEDAYRAQLNNQIPETPKQLPQQPKQQFLPQQPKQQFVAQQPKQQFVQQNEVNNLKLELPNKMVVKTEFIAPKLPVYLEKDEENSLEEEKEENNLKEKEEEDNLKDEEEEDNLKDEEEEDNLNDEETTESDDEESSSTYVSKKNVLEIYSNENLEETSKVNCSEELEDVLNNLEIEINNDILPTNKYDSSNLAKLKVSELQEIAKKENISLEKKVNGSNKKKTKQDLIDELITK